MGHLPLIRGGYPLRYPLPLPFLVKFLVFIGLLAVIRAKFLILFGSSPNFFD